MRPAGPRVDDGKFSQHGHPDRNAEDRHPRWNAGLGFAAGARLRSMREGSTQGGVLGLPKPSVLSQKGQVICLLTHQYLTLMKSYRRVSLSKMYSDVISQSLSQSTELVTSGKSPEPEGEA